MMAASSSMSKFALSQKKKMMQPPHILPTEFLVTDDAAPRKYTLPVSRKRSLSSEIDLSGPIPLLPPRKRTRKFSYTSIGVFDLKQYALEKLPKLAKTAPLRAIFDQIHEETTYKDMWINKYQPKRMDELLVHKLCIKKIGSWIDEALVKLEARPVRDISKKLKKKNIDPFIVFDDLGGYVDDFMPVLILQGSCGCGKSTTIHTAMNERDGYVHEINSGMPRGRKDIFNSLKELCTTQLVHDTTEFQKGLILFEDVDIIFEQDKSFWSVVDDLSKITKRPIVLTCEEVKEIPRNILVLSELINMDEYPISRRLVRDYIWLCGLASNYDAEDSIVEAIVSENWKNHNLRKTIMAAEMLCKIAGTKTKFLEEDTLEMMAQPISTPTLTPTPKCELTRISTISKAKTSNLPFGNSDGLREQSILFDLQSVLNHDCHIEVDSYSPLDFVNTIQLPTITKDFEQDDMVIYAAEIDKMHTECLNFIESRTKYPYQERRATRVSTRMGSFEPAAGIPEDSRLYNLSPTSIVLDLLPFTRIWQAFQEQIDKLEEKCSNEGKPSIKAFIRYRDFQYQSNLALTIGFNQNKE